MRLLPDLVLSPDGWQAGRAVAVTDGRIAMVQPADPPQRGDLPLPGRALLPGTVNSHCHSFQSLLRGLGDCRFAPADASLGFDGGEGWTVGFSATWETPTAALPTMAFGDYQELDAAGEWTGRCSDDRLLRPASSGTPKGAESAERSQRTCSTPAAMKAVKRKAVQTTGSGWLIGVPRATGRSPSGCGSGTAARRRECAWLATPTTTTASGCAAGMGSCADDSPAPPGTCGAPRAHRR